jgi:hypothetical protein
MDNLFNTNKDIIENINEHNFCTIDKCNSIQEKNSELKKTIIKGNFCLICGINMGDDNPRQLCGKFYCMQEDDL